MRRMVGGSLATVSLAPHADEKPGAFPTHSRSLPRSLLYTKRGHVWVRVPRIDGCQKHVCTSISARQSQGRGLGVRVVLTRSLIWSW